MPPSNAAWSFLHDRRVLVLAFALSVALHLFAWLATPYLVRTWREPAAARFDAVLVPIIVSRATAPSASINSLKRTRRIAKSTPPRPASAPTAEAHFAAPENAIAVDRAPETGNENAGMAEAMTDEKAAIAEEVIPGGSAPKSAAEASLRPAPLAAESKAPDPQPPQLPARISIAYNMTSSISDGVADYTWNRNHDRFEIDSTMQATGFIIGNFVGVLHQISRGLVTPTGLQPDSFQIRRGEGAADTAEFLRASNELKLTRAGEVRLLPLPPLIQDMQSFLFQIAYDAPKLQGVDDRLDVLVTNARKVYRHRFRQVGIETVDMRSGPVRAMHLRSEASDPEDAYEVWLAPDNYYLPVKIKFYAGRFPVELIATSIRTTP
jgi:hypothetical protein